MHVIISKDPHRAAWDLSYGPGQSDRSFGSLAAALEFAAADGAGLKVEILGSLLPVSRIDTSNKFLVAAARDGGRHALTMLNPPRQCVMISCDDALLLAATLVALAEPNASRTFAEVLEAVQNT